MQKSEAAKAAPVDPSVERSGRRTLLLHAAQAALKASEERYRTIVTASDDGIWTTDTEMKTTFANDRVAQMLGYTAEEMIGRSADDFVDPSARDSIREGFARRRQGTRERREVPLRRKDGTILWAGVTANPLMDSDGNFVGSLVMGTDITERRRLEQERQQLERRFRLMVEHSADGIALLTADGIFTYVSPAAERIFGRRREDLVGRRAIEFLHPDDASKRRNSYRRSVAPGTVEHLEFRSILPDGTTRWIEGSSVNRLDEAGIEAFVATFRDVTEQRRLEDDRRRSEERFRTIFRANPGAIGIGRGGTILDANDRYCEFYGYERSELIGLNVQELGFWVDPSDRVRMLEGVRAKGAVHDFATRFRRKDGTIRDALMAAEPVELDGESAHDAEPTLLIMVTDVTEREAAAVSLRESEERYRVLFDESPMPMWAYDPESLQIVMANQAAADQYGYTQNELVALALPDIRPAHVDAEEIRAVNRALPRGRLGTGLWQHRRKDGSLIDVDVHLNDVRLDGKSLRLAVLHDVTQRRGLEEQLRQSQKMEAVGRLAGGVAHDFNNLLTAIIGYSDLLADRFKVGDPERAEIQEIRRAGERAAALTRQLLAFSRKQVLVPEALDLGSVVRGLSRLLERLIGETITVSVVVAPGLGRVMADPGQMEQVVMNLALNARDAMPKGGELLLEIRNVDLDDAYERAHLGAAAGPYVMLAVSDTGVGMPLEVQKQIFEPFFTTKPLGEGTGLGLATVHGIVNQSGGTIWVTSEPGSGTTFKIYLPRISGGVDSPQSAAGSVLPALESPRTILLVEDAEQLRKLAKRILELGHYTVLEARSPAHALEIARAHVEPIDLLLTDVVMPGMSGPELAAALLLERPGVPVLYMSGYTDDAIVHHGVLDAGTQFIPKPFTPSTLIRRVHESLGGPVS